MKTWLLALALLANTFPLIASAQGEGESVQSIHVDEQITLGEIMVGKRAVFVRALQLTDQESREFWPVYDDYEARVKKIDDRFVQLIDDYAAEYPNLTEVTAQRMLAEKLKIDWERMALQQEYTRRIARTLPAGKALRYAQVEARIDNEMQRKVMLLVPLVP